MKHIPLTLAIIILLPTVAVAWIFYLLGNKVYWKQFKKFFSMEP